MVKDKFGYDMIYLTKKGGMTWFMNNADPDSDKRFYIGSSVNGLVKAGSYWKCKDNDKVRLNVQTPQTVGMDNALGGCKLDYKKAADRGNAGMSDAWTNVEMTGLINLTQFSPSDGRFIMKGPTFHHSDDKCCSGHAYGVRFFFRNPLQIQFFKEMWHVNYFSRPDNETNTKYASIKDGKDHVCKYIVYTKTINNKKCRVLEAWIDFDADGSKFTKVASVTDSGGWGDGGGQCNGNDDQILTWGSGWMMYRWDADGSTDIKFKNWSVREIDVELDEETQTTDTIDTRSTETTIIIPLTLNFDVNAKRTTPCMTGTLSDSFYYKAVTQTSSQWRDLCDHINHNNRIMYVNHINTGSGAYGKKLAAVRKPLNKRGSPASSPKVYCKIWDSGGNVKYTSPTNIDPTTLTSTMAFYSFDFTTCTRTMANGDRVGLIYEGTDPDNCVRTCYLVDDAGTDAEMYDINGWYLFDTRVMSCEYFE